MCCCGGRLENQGILILDFADEVHMCCISGQGIRGAHCPMSKDMAVNQVWPNLGNYAEIHVAGSCC